MNTVEAAKKWFGVHDVVSVRHLRKENLYYLQCALEGRGESSREDLQEMNEAEEDTSLGSEMPAILWKHPRVRDCASR